MNSIDKDSANFLAHSKDGERYPSIPSSTQPAMIFTSRRLPIMSTSISNKTAESFPPDIQARIVYGRPSS